MTDLTPEVSKYEALEQENAKLREALREIEERTRQNGDMADRAVNDRVQQALADAQDDGKEQADDRTALFAELKALEAKATKGPWHVMHVAGGRDVWLIRNQEDYSTAPTPSEMEFASYDGRPRSTVDAALIATARNALPRLIEALETAQRRIEALEEIAAQVAQSKWSNPMTAEPERWVAGSYRKKPVVVYAVQFWPEKEPWPEDVLAHVDYEGNPVDLWWIKTLEGEHAVKPSDWIITGIKGERYPCRDDIFRLTYKPADATREQPEVPADARAMAQKVYNAIDTKLTKPSYEIAAIITQELAPLYRERDELRTKLAELAACAVEHDAGRYVTVQIPRVVWEELRA